MGKQSILQERYKHTSCCFSSLVISVAMYPWFSGYPLSLFSWRVAVWIIDFICVYILRRCGSTRRAVATRDRNSPPPPPTRLLVIIMLLSTSDFTNSRIAGQNRSSAKLAVQVLSNLIWPGSRAKTMGNGRLWCRSILDPTSYECGCWAKIDTDDASCP